jgi:putative inorganic carbon (HCO3(-)) transporter
MFIHFGLEGTTGLILYLAAIVCVFATIFWRPIVGIFFLLPLIPLQTIRYRMNDYPLGSSMVWVILLAVAIGLIRLKRPLLPKTPWTILLVIYMIYTLISLIWGSAYLGVELPRPGDPRFSVWMDYMMMPGLLLLVAALQPTRGQAKAMILLMCAAVLVLDKNFYSMVSGRDFSQFAWDLREGGNMGYAGTNGLAAFEAQFTTFLLAISAFEEKWWLKHAYHALALFSGVCLMYSLSRGGYVAMLMGWLFIGLFKRRWMLVLMVVFLSTWTTIVPNAVKQRVFMTYDSEGGELDHSAETRLTLWEDAMQVFDSNVVMGSGFNTYQYMHRVGDYEDTHNFYLKLLVETGVLGLGLFLWFVGKSFLVGMRVSKRAKDPFLASLGLGLAGWLAAAGVANFFGDRWNFLQVCGYLWVIAGLVAGLSNREQESAEIAEGGELAVEQTPMEAAPAF